MRRLASILFLLIFLFNVGGYYFVFWGLQHHANKNLLKSLDNQTYSSGDEITITIPMTLPYAIHEQGFQRVDGEFEYQGEYYKLVKQKLEDDMLILVCVKDHQQKKIASAMSDFAKVANNLPGSSKQALNLLAKLYKDFQRSNSPLLTMGGGWCRDISYTELNLTPLQEDGTITVPPPKVS